MKKQKTPKMIRYSGMPVSLDALNQFKAEFEAAYDKIVAKNGPNMTATQQDLEALDTELAKKWDKQLEVQLPKSQKNWKKMIDDFQGPIMIARSADDPEQLVFVIMDQGLP